MYSFKSKRWPGRRGGRRESAGRHAFHHFRSSPAKESYVNLTKPVSAALWQGLQGSKLASSFWESSSINNTSVCVCVCVNHLSNFCQPGALTSAFHAIISPCQIILVWTTQEYTPVTLPWPRASLIIRIPPTEEFSSRKHAFQIQTYPPRPTALTASFNGL